MFNWHNRRKHRFHGFEFIECSKLGWDIEEFLSHPRTIALMGTMLEQGTPTLERVEDGDLKGVWFETSLALSFIAKNDAGFQLEMIREVTAAVPNIMEEFKRMTAAKRN